MTSHDEVDVVVVGLGAAGGVLVKKLAEAGWRVVGLDAGPHWDPHEDFVSDERTMHKLYWRDRRVTGGDSPIELAGNVTGRKMLHQAGHSPQADMGDNPFDAYYGDYATPVDFVAMLGQYYAWTNDLQTGRELISTAKKALIWLERYADLDGDGLIEYRKRSPKGVLN